RYPSGKIRWGWPTTGKVINSYSASQPGKKGIDIAGKSGQPVVAAAEGKVVYSGSGLKGYGKLIIIKHNNNYFSAYAHNKKIVVKEGSWVKRGNKIAELGNTGADRTMLHFEIRRNGKPVNPLGYLPRR
ncbi:MAG: peptidoglycan DD-metalloendopeptidase family protein, partial [Gammaproteobacteria bacterium]|nr:peptidoglycan DD-metalloendopeptidase family protein [Gammaproteobacteria bacterium]